MTRAWAAMGGAPTGERGVERMKENRGIEGEVRRSYLLMKRQERKRNTRVRERRGGRGREKGGEKRIQTNEKTKSICYMFMHLIAQGPRGQAQGGNLKKEFYNKRRSHTTIHATGKK